MASVVVRHFRSILSGSAPKLRMGQTSAARTTRAVGMSNNCLSMVARRDVSSLPVTHTEANGAATPARHQMHGVPALEHASVQDALKNIDLVVYDMAGTTVEEGGLVYQTLRRVMVEDGIQVSQEAMSPWHGAKKEAVIEHFARQGGTPEHEIDGQIQRVSAAFEKSISDAYFSKDSKVGLINDGLPKYFEQLKAAGIKIGLDTGYPADIQEGLVQKLGFDKMVDSYVSSYDVSQGRPYPYMIYRLMERLDIKSAARVAKLGDSVRDMEEGRNAGCGLVVGVLSGADSAEALLAAGADFVVPMVTDLPAPRADGAEIMISLE